MIPFFRTVEVSVTHCSICQGVVEGDASWYSVLDVNRVVCKKVRKTDELSSVQALEFLFLPEFVFLHVKGKLLGFFSLSSCSLRNNVLFK